MTTSRRRVDADNRANLYDAQSGQLVQVGTGNMPRGGYTPGSKQFRAACRLCLGARARGKNVVRGGYGIYYNQGSLATSEGLYFNPPYFNLNVYFPGTGDGRHAGGSLPGLVSGLHSTVRDGVSADLANALDGTLERQRAASIGHERSIEFGYVGSRGHDLISARDLNQAPASPNPPNLRPIRSLRISRSSSRALRRSYNALQVRYQDRPSNGTWMLVSYTLGKSTDDASGFFTSAGDPNFPQNSLDPAASAVRRPSMFGPAFGRLIQPLPFEPGQLLGELGMLQQGSVTRISSSSRLPRAGGPSP